MKIVTLVLALAIFGTMSLAPVCSAAEYTVYCANGKIEVDMRDEAQMKSARGGNVKVLSKFQYKTDADNFAKKLGGAGAQCN